MYFKNFPKTYFSLDNYKSATLFTNLLVRTKFLDEVLSNYVFYDKYNIRDGESPEVTSDVFYGDSEMHWTILHANNILDPRFGWVFTPFDLQKYTQGKYANVNSVHHYEDTNQNYVNANVRLRISRRNFDVSNNRPTAIDVNTVLVNNTSSGVAVITSKVNQRTFDVEVSKGGFIAGEVLFPSDNVSYLCNVVSVIQINNNAIPVTNITFEDRENEKRRTISVLKAEVVGEAVQEFQALMKK